MRLHRQNNPEVVQANDRARYYRNWEKRRAASAAYQKENRERVTQLSAEWRRRNPEKAKAHSKVAREIRAGRLKRKPCEVCGSTKVQAHHDDYSKHLEVRWLCARHHSEHHRKYEIGT